MNTDTLLLVASVLVIGSLVYLIFAGVKLSVIERSGFLAKIVEAIAPVRTHVQESMDKAQELHIKHASESRQEVSSQFRTFSEMISMRFDTQDKGQTKQLVSMSDQVDKLTKNTLERFDKLSEVLLKSMSDIKGEVGTNLEKLRVDNNTKLEQMRGTVDEKLQKTLESRLGKSFELVSKQLEAVQRGLGEMQGLAAGVGDLKKVLTNVKTRGIMGELQLANILEQVLAPDQYDSNINTIPKSPCRVEFAIKLPGRDAELKHIWLPIDSKFPKDKYEMLSDAYDTADKTAIEDARTQLVRAVKMSAKDISEKYIEPPFTTDFAILFLPFEGLYAEVTRVPGLIEDLKLTFNVVVAGPSNLMAFLSAIQMGFKTLAIEQRSSEVWKILGAVKADFGKFGAILEKVNEKLVQASKTIGDAGVRSRAIERKLRDVEELPTGEARLLLNGAAAPEEAIVEN
jgi:DNA recombination protein RmuC